MHYLKDLATCLKMLTKYTIDPQDIRLIIKVIICRDIVPQDSNEVLNLLGLKYGMQFLWIQESLHLAYSARNIKYYY